MLFLAWTSFLFSWNHSVRGALDSVSFSLFEIDVALTPIFSGFRSAHGRLFSFFVGHWHLHLGLRLALRLCSVRLPISSPSSSTPTAIPHRRQSRNMLDFPPHIPTIHPTHLPETRSHSNRHHHVPRRIRRQRSRITNTEKRSYHSKYGMGITVGL